MEFMFGFVMGGLCVVILLVWWGRRHASSTSVQPHALPQDSKQSYEHVIAEMEEQSDTFLQELQETFSTYPRKRR
jgi:hypothetical protein